MKTKHKIILARFLFKLISFFVINSSSIIYCRRNNINWSLDLKEGIDLYLYLFGEFEPGIIKTVKKLGIEDSNNNSILDIGSNIGAHTLQLASMFPNSRIFSIEPTDYAFNKL